MEQKYQVGQTVAIDVMGDVIAVNKKYNNELEYKILIGKPGIDEIWVREDFISSLPTEKDFPEKTLDKDDV